MTASQRARGFFDIFTEAIRIITPGTVLKSLRCPFLLGAIYIWLDACKLGEDLI